MAGGCIANAGKMRHRVAIQSNSVIQDDFGQEIKTWVTDSSAYARIEPLRGRERIEALQVAPEVSHKITMRKNTVNAENRILFESRIFNIEAVLNVDEADIILEILCKESPEP